MQISFIYFDFPFWRAELGKIALFCGDINFNIRTISFDEFERVKDKGELDDGTIIPFHQLPCLVVDGVSIAQTGGIARFCGKLSGMYPTGDDILAARIDSFIDFATDITATVSAVGKHDEEEIRIKKRKELANGELARKLRMLDRYIDQSGRWTIGNAFGLPDIVIWRLMGWLTGGVVDGIPSDIIIKYPQIQRICLQVEAHEKIRKWILKTYPDGYVRGNYEGV